MKYKTILTRSGSLMLVLLMSMLVFMLMPHFVQLSVLPFVFK